MPIYSAALYPEEFDGALDAFGGTPPIAPCDVIDANGNVIDRFITYFDTDTGIVMSSVKNPDGSWKEWDSSWSSAGQKGRQPSGGLVRKIELFPAPLTTRPFLPPSPDPQPIILEAVYDD